MFEVTYKDKVVSGYNSTQREAKEAAEHIAEKIAKHSRKQIARFFIAATSA